jgi:hypothetical protein
MNLKEKRVLFSSLVPLLLMKMLDAGYHPMIGRDGLKHMPNSLHYSGLAIDIDLLDKDFVYIKDTSGHKIFGEFWESLHPDCCWGGRFSDGNHYSVTYQGRK